MIVKRIALASRVLVVASVTPRINQWAAYIDAVPGISHSDEEEAVRAYGNKLPKELAELLFPEIAKEYTWRD